MLMLSPAVFAVVIFFIVLPGEVQQAVPKDEAVIFQTVAAALAVISVGLSQLLPRFMLRDEKFVLLRKYTSMKIVQWALIEGAAFFIGIVFFMTQQKSLLIPMGVLIALLALMRPTPDEIERYRVKEDQ